MLSLENEGAEVMQKSADRIPRCGSCRAYMNCYNTIEKRKYICFYCNRENSLEQYDLNEEPNLELTYPMYQALGPSK